MAARTKPEKSPVAAISSLALVAAVFLAWYFWNATPPQLGDDERTRSAVDALFTAVTAKDDKLLAQCEARLNALRNDGALAAEASKHLEDIISQAKTGEWQTAARRLYKFIQGQRGESL
jgi:hypothetical protein